jgi:hypothetical protein
VKNKRKGALISSKRLKQMKVLRVRESDEKEKKFRTILFFAAGTYLQQAALSQLAILEASRVQ